MIAIAESTDSGVRVFVEVNESTYIGIVDKGYWNAEEYLLELSKGQATELHKVLGEYLEQ